MNANLMATGDDNDVVDLEWAKYQPGKIILTLKSLEPPALVLQVRILCSSLMVDSGPLTVNLV